MMTNCYEYLNYKYRNSIIDEILYDQFDWIKITRPFEFYTEHQFPLYQLTENEIEVQNIMKIERDRVYIYIYLYYTFILLRYDKIIL